jgi:hypothetical protein
MHHAKCRWGAWRIISPHLLRPGQAGHGWSVVGSPRITSSVAVPVQEDLFLGGAVPIRTGEDGAGAVIKEASPLGASAAAITTRIARNQPVALDSPRAGIVMSMSLAPCNLARLGRSVSLRMAPSRPRTAWWSRGCSG